MSLMAQEAREAPHAVAQFLRANAAAVSALARDLRDDPPAVILTAARGSSDHAATYFKYLAEILLGIPCASMGASVVSVWGAKLHLTRTFCLTISQSGQSPDLLRLQQAAREAGARDVAVVNDSASPLATHASLCLPLCAGTERSVAATKSCIASMAAGAALVAEWTQDAALKTALAALPDGLAHATHIEWPDFQPRLKAAQSLYVLGRGPGLAIAQEVALKLKETCALHAEALSFAEVMHGPLELVRKGFPVIALVPGDAAQELSLQATQRLRAAGADVLLIGEGGFDFARTGHALLDPVSMLLTTYLHIEALARALGRDPDGPLLLSKVTKTQ